MFSLSMFKVSLAFPQSWILCGDFEFELLFHSQGQKDKKLSKKLQKQHQTVKLTHSNGTNISVNITEELGKTSIWRQLTDGKHNDLKSQPWVKNKNSFWIHRRLSSVLIIHSSNRFLDPANMKESLQQSEKRLSTMNEEDEMNADEKKRSTQNISQV